jgi:hypothetical protein
MKKLLFLLILIAIALTSHPAVVQCQQLTIQTENGKQTVLSRADIEALPHTDVKSSAAGAQSTFVGVSVKALVEKAGVVFGEAMRGKRLSSCLLVEAADGYRVVIALPEIDSAFTDKQVVLAFLRDGKPLDEKEGPYRIVIPDEKRMARWVKRVTTLKIVDVQ